MTLSKRDTVYQLFIVAIVIATFFLRLYQPDEAPPGWRDDELVNLYTLSGEVLRGNFPFYFTGASGHEPLYHYLHAGVLAAVGYNVMGGHFLSIACGTLTVALTYVLIRRLLGPLPALLSSLFLATSFWSLMYSRFGMRHISLVPLTLLVLYLLCAPLTPRRRPLLHWAVPLGVALGLGPYIYPAGRLLPLFPLLFGLYLALFHRDIFRRSWRGYGLALGIGVLLMIPLGLAILQGQSAEAAQGIGADARLAELARPIYALREGDPGPLLETVWITLGMFHATGDPEWLYNIGGRPLFNLFGGLLFWIGLLICLYRWRRPRYLLLALWLGIGLLPTVLSVPPASLSHSILIQPLTYLLPVLPLVAAYRWLTQRLPPRGGPIRRLLLLCCVLLILSPSIYRDLWDYFHRWPQEEETRFLYRADYRQAARYLDAHPEQQDWAVGSLLMGPWDRLALEIDTQREDLALRLFDPRRALVYVAGEGPTSILIPVHLEPSPFIAQRLRGSIAQPLPAFTHYSLEPDRFSEETSLAQFANGLELESIAWEGGTPPSPGEESVLITHWRVSAPLQLPPMPVVANPPPPGVYAGPRLAVFTHILGMEGGLLIGDDGLWVDPLTLHLGDRFVQIHHLSLPRSASPGPYTLAMGLYDPFTGERWTVHGAAAASASDHLLFQISPPTP